MGKRKAPSVTDEGDSNTNAAVATAPKAARSMKDVTSAHKLALSTGLTESRNLVEMLSIDFNVLLASMFPKKKLVIDNSLGVTKRMITAAEVINQNLGYESYHLMKEHKSDVARGIACYVLCSQPFPIQKLVTSMYVHAVDEHSGVREWAWMALRPHLANDLSASIPLLLPMVHDANVFAQRFAVEVLRPRGVWCSHIQELKEKPQIGLPLLEPLKCSEHKYVQDSVANWLNDASKSQPTWVRNVCKQWLADPTANEHTKRICTRALRTLVKK